MGKTEREALVWKMSQYGRNERENGQRIPNDASLSLKDSYCLITMDCKL